MNMLLSNILLIFNLSFFSNSLLNEKVRSRYIHYTFLTLIVIILTFKNYTSNELLGTFIMSFSYTLYVFFFFRAVTYKKVLVIVLFVLTASLSEIFVANFMNYFFDLTPDKIDTFLYTGAIISSNIIIFLILFILSKFIKINISNKYTKSVWVSLILPVTTLLFLFNFTDYFNTFRDNFMTLFIILGLICSNAILLYMVIKGMKQIELNNEIKKEKMKYEILNTQYNNNYYFLHDTIRKMNKLSMHMEKGNFQDFQEDVRDISQNLVKNFNTITSNYELLNTLLNYRILEMEKYDIDVKSIIEYSDFSFISFEDQQVLFSELLSIAIASCIEANKKRNRIIFKTKKINQQVIIKCSFTFCNSHNINSNKLCGVVNKYRGNMSEIVIEESNSLYNDIILVFDINN